MGRKLKGQLKINRFKSKILKNNPLKDPYIRDVLVYLPNSYSSSFSKVYPAIFLLPSFGNNNYSTIRNDPFSFSIFHILDNLIKNNKCGQMLIVIVDCFNRFGGSQYLNSDAIGNYSDYLVKEIVPYINSKYNISDNALIGKSSGGYGAVTLGMQFPKKFKAIAAHSFDSAFEYCYLIDFPVAFKMLKEEGDPFKWLTRFWNKKNKSERKDFITLNTLSMAAHYSPGKITNGSKIKINLPFDLRTGQLKEKVWKKWKIHDPINMVNRFKHNLKNLKLLYFDCGISDEFNLFIGTKIFSEKCKKYGITHEYVQYNGGHFNTNYRYFVSLPKLYSCLSR